MDYSSEEKMLQTQIDSENARHDRAMQNFKVRKRALADKKQRQKEIDKLKKKESYSRIENLNNELKMLLENYKGF